MYGSAWWTVNVFEKYINLINHPPFSGTLESILDAGSLIECLWFFWFQMNYECWAVLPHLRSSHFWKCRLFTKFSCSSILRAIRSVLRSTLNIECIIGSQELESDSETIFIFSSWKVAFAVFYVPFQIQIGQMNDLLLVAFVRGILAIKSYT